MLPEGRFVGRYALPEGPDHGVVVVEIVTPGFDGGDGARRGALVDRVRVLIAPPALPSARSIAAFVIPAAVIAAAAASAGLAPAAAALVAASVSVAEALALSNDGLLFSPYAVTLARLLVLAALVAWLAARGFERVWPGSGAGAFGTLFLALVVQGIAATSPVMVSSDVVFHANRLRDAAGGELLPDQRHATRDAVSHPVWRLPLRAARSARVAGPRPREPRDRGRGPRRGDRCCRWRSGCWRAATCATRRLRSSCCSCCPATFDDLFLREPLERLRSGRDRALLLLVERGSPGGFIVGGLLLAAAGISHLSSLIVLVVLAVALVLARGSKLRATATRLHGARPRRRPGPGLLLALCGPRAVSARPALRGRGHGRAGSRGPGTRWATSFRASGAVWLARAAARRRRPAGLAPSGSGGSRWRARSRGLSRGAWASWPCRPSSRRSRSAISTRWALPVAVGGGSGFLELRAGGRAAGARRVAAVRRAVGLAA